jgi:glycosyltransferase involved in cell wall biosynthesis
MTRQRHTLERCDAVLASTDVLVDRVRTLGKPVWAHRNAANLELVYLSDQARRGRRLPGAKVVIGYASGTPTHNHDFATIAPALQEILTAHPQTELWIIGPLDTGDGWSGFDDRIRRFPAVPWRELPLMLADLDINLAPLALDNPFSQSKSEIKYMEAALVGTPTIASPTEAFKYAIRHGENGYLAETVKDWALALESLLDERVRNEVGTQAYIDVHRRYTPLVRAQEGARLLNEISAALGCVFRIDINLDRVAASPQLWWSSDSERQPTLLRMAVYTTRRRGVMTLLKQVWIYFRRWLAKFIPYE